MFEILMFSWYSIGVLSFIVWQFIGRDKITLGDCIFCWLVGLAGPVVIVAGFDVYRERINEVVIYKRKSKGND